MAGGRAVLRGSPSGDLFERFLEWPDSVSGGNVCPRWAAGGERFRFEDGGKEFEVDVGARRMRQVPDEPESDQGLMSGALMAAMQQVSAELQWDEPPCAWSPDGRHAIALSEDLSQLHRLPMVEYAAIERVTTSPYPKAGTRGADTRAWLWRAGAAVLDVTPIRADDGALLWLVGWSRDGCDAYFLHLTRDAKALSLLALNVDSRSVRTPLTERSATFVAGLDFPAWGPRHQFTPLADGRRFLWLSERAHGRRQIELHAFDGGPPRVLGPVDGVVDGIEGVDLVEGWVYCTTLHADRTPAERHLQRLHLSDGRSERLTIAATWHEVALSPRFDVFVDNRSSPHVGPVAELWPVEGARAAGMTLSVADTSTVDALGRRGPELVSVMADDACTPLMAAIYRPRDLAAGERRPVIDYIYAGPFESSVPQRFLPARQSRFAEALAQCGFVVTIIDGRGLPGRGKAFQDHTYGRIGESEIADHVWVLQALARERPEMDLSRAGVLGHSWGGYFALRAMLTAPDVFRAGVASAPGELTEHAFIHEPYMGLPADNPEGYARGLNAPLAHRLEGALLLIHGTDDVNAPVSTTMRMARALIDADKSFEMLVMPGFTHAITGLRYWQRTVRRFFERHLLGAGRGLG